MTKIDLDLSREQRLFVKITALQRIREICEGINPPNMCLDEIFRLTIRFRPRLENGVRLLYSREADNSLKFFGDGDNVLEARNDIEKLFVRVPCKLSIDLKQMTPTQNAHIRRVQKEFKVMFFSEGNKSFALAIDRTQVQAASEAANNLKKSEKTISLTSRTFSDWEKAETEAKEKFPSVAFEVNREQYEVTLAGYDGDKLAEAEDFVNSKISTQTVIKRIRLSEEETDFAKFIQRSKLRDEFHLDEVRLDGGQFVLKGPKAEVEAAAAKIRDHLNSITTRKLSTTIHPSLRRFLGTKLRDFSVRVTIEDNEATLKGTEKGVQDAMDALSLLSTKKRNLLLSRKEVRFVQNGSGSLLFFFISATRITRVFLQIVQDEDPHGAWCHPLDLPLTRCERILLEHFWL